MMLIGVVADDFTGASDIANTLAKGLPGQGGLRTAQFLGVPRGPAPAGIEAGVVALKSRSIPAGEAVALSLAALDWLQAQGCRQFVFKYCSTFDSTPQGNIGPVGEAMADALGAKGVIACPAFPAAGRTVYQGHLFVHDRLLSESDLRHHPVNPMTDADLARWLRQQTRAAVGCIAHRVVAGGADALAAALGAAAARGETLVVVDAIDDADLVAIAGAAADAALVTGGSGIAMGLPANFIARGDAEGQVPGSPEVRGPAAILAGSCSGATRGQVERHAAQHPVFRVDAALLLEGKLSVADAAAFLGENRSGLPLVYSSGTPDEVASVQRRYGAQAVSHALDTFFADLARVAVGAGLRRLVVAGGETSGAVVSALDLGALEIGREIDPGVPVLVASGAPPLALALKSGNFGGPDFFARAAAIMEGAA